MLILYLAVLMTAMYWVVKLLGPEMAKPAQRKFVPGSDSLNNIEANDPYKRIEKLESMLAEKNKNIQLLQTELKIFVVQVREFDKVKNMLEEEVHRLKEQNRIFRSELGLPATQPKELSVA